MSDLRLAFRQLLKNPGFTAVAVLTLALGLGANTAIFAVINSLVLRSLPVREPGQLAQASLNGVNGRSDTFTYPAYQRLREGAQSFSGLLAAGNIGQGRMVASGMGGTEIEMVHLQPVTGNFFSVLGVRPFLGRLLAESDDK